MGQVRWLRIAFIPISLASLVFPFFPAGHTAPKPNSADLVPLVAAYHGAVAKSNLSTPAEKRRTGNSGGIREHVPPKYVARYQHWKREFLSTETGRQQWDSYQNNPNFTLTVVVTRENPEGGTTGDYEWDEHGKLIAATITLGCRLDEGVPNPIYFPVMNSLLPTETTRNIGGETMAATKMAHEFGHVNRTANGDSVLYQLQLNLMPEYNRILLSNGRDVHDPRLIELQKRMGATPVEIWEDREYWGETNAMLYLRDRFAENSLRCLLFSRIKRSIELYAPGYEERFLTVAQSLPSDRRCGW